MELRLSPDCLVVFLDDTGHERLAKGHSVYGLGGCTTLARDLDRVIRDPWREVRKTVTGSADKPLHAFSFGRDASQDQIDAVAQFFRNQPFGRLAATVSIQTALVPEMDLLTTVSSVLKNRILELARWTSFREIKVIFESSDRSNRLIERAFGNLGIAENGLEVSAECYFMPKSAAEPALEVADFIMHAAGRQGRHKVEQRSGFVPDFRAVFHEQNPKLVSFMHVDRVETHARSAPQVTSA